MPMSESMRLLQSSIKREQLSECYAWCHMFDVRFKCVCEPVESNTRLHHWIHQIWTVNEHGNVLRQETVEGMNIATWKAAIGRLVSVRPQNLW